MARDRAHFFLLAHQALQLTQVELGQKLGAARRTAQRWAQSGVPAPQLPDLARLVHPRDPALAAEIAAAAGTSLAALGLLTPTDPATSAPPAPLPAPPPLPDSVVDAVVCAAAEAMALPPGQVRPGLLAAFARAGELGLTVATIERVLRGPPARASASAARARGTG